MNTKVEPLVYRIPVVNSAFFGACVYVCGWVGVVSPVSLSAAAAAAKSLRIYKNTSIRGLLSFHTRPPFYGAEAVAIIQVV